jgi:hypothetical protein
VRSAIEQHIDTAQLDGLKVEEEAAREALRSMAAMHTASDDA